MCTEQTAWICKSPIEKPWHFLFTNKGTLKARFIPNILSYICPIYCTSGDFVQVTFDETNHLRVFAEAGVVKGVMTQAVDRLHVTSTFQEHVHGVLTAVLAAQDQGSSKKSQQRCWVVKGPFREEIWFMVYVFSLRINLLFLICPKSKYPSRKTAAYISRYRKLGVWTISIFLCSDNYISKKQHF